MTSMERRKAQRKLNRTDTSKTWDNNQCAHAVTEHFNGVVTCLQCGGMRLEEQSR